MLRITTTGPQGVPGPQGPAGPPGPGGAGTGVIAATGDDGLVLHGLTPVPILTSPPVQTTGLYFVNASVSFQVGADDILFCQLTPSSVEPTDEQVGTPVTSYENLAVTGAVSLSAGQEVSVSCENLATTNSVTGYAEGDLNAVLISNTNSVGSAN